VTAVATARLERIGEMVCAVALQLLRDRGRSRLALLDDGSPEAALALRMLRPLGDAAVRAVKPDERQVESVLHALDLLETDAAARAEVHRLLLRSVEDAVPALAWNKTALLLGGDPPPVTFLPLGDLYASEVAILTGGWSAPAAVRELVDAAGGVERLDAALRRRLEGREPDALLRLPGDPGERVEALLATGAAGRTAAWVVPKLGTRTLGLDLFE
jgi:hypothetical protein